MGGWVCMHAHACVCAFMRVHWWKGVDGAVCTWSQLLLYL